MYYTIVIYKYDDDSIQNIYVTAFTLTASAQIVINLKLIRRFQIYIPCFYGID